MRNHQTASANQRRNRSGNSVSWAVGEFIGNDYLTAMRPQDILLPTPNGVCCKLGGFHIDPTRPVDRAVITHGHSDHARAGHGAVLATAETIDLMRVRY